MDIQNLIAQIKARKVIPGDDLTLPYRGEGSSTNRTKATQVTEDKANERKRRQLEQQQRRGTKQPKPSPTEIKVRHRCPIGPKATEAMKAFHDKHGAERKPARKSLRFYAGAQNNGELAQNLGVPAGACIDVVTTGICKNEKCTADHPTTCPSSVDDTKAAEIITKCTEPRSNEG